MHLKEDVGLGLRLFSELKHLCPVEFINYELVSVLFTGFKGFTRFKEKPELAVLLFHKLALALNSHSMD